MNFGYVRTSDNVGHVLGGNTNPSGNFGRNIVATGMGTGAPKRSVFQACIMASGNILLAGGIGLNEAETGTVIMHSIGFLWPDGVYRSFNYVP